MEKNINLYKENNKLIAQFLGLTIITDGISLFDTNYKALAKYHESWNDLMPVVEKIESMGYDFTMIKNYCRITTNTGGTFENELGSANQETKIAAAYKLVIEFIKWYNTQPHTKTVNN